MVQKLGNFMATFDLGKQMRICDVPYSPELTAEASPVLPTTLTSWREQVVITMTFLPVLN